MKLKEYLSLLLKNKYTLTILKSLGTLALLTAVCAISVHYLVGDTLSDYAEKNPDIAYRNIEEIPHTANQNNTIDDGSDNSTNYKENNVTTSDDLDTLANLEDTSDNSTDSTADLEQDVDDSGATSTKYNVSNMIHFYDPDADNPDITYYEDGFYYEPLTDDMLDYISGVSLPVDNSNLAIETSDLRYVGILYIDFNGLTQAGELICNKSIADDLVEIFYELYQNDYQLERIVLVDNYGGDDTASMCANNTSCFNYRPVDNSSSLSNHAYGLAIDINPFYNPYIVFGGNEDGSDYISPSGSERFADRTQSFAYKIDENDLCYKLFIQHGFKWGGNWNSCKDYQHFQKK